MESDTDGDDEIQDVSSRLEFMKMKNSLMTSGFRDGAGAGKDAIFQRGFDKGFSEGLNAGLALGKHNGSIEIIIKNSTEPTSFGVNTGNLFHNSRIGLCQLCKTSGDQGSISTTGKSLTSDSFKCVSDTIAHQRNIIEAALESHKTDCLPLLEIAGRPNVSET